MKTFNIKTILSLLTFISIMLLPVSSSAEESDDLRFNVGYSIKTYNDVDVKDATAALQLWVRELGKTFGYTVNAKIYLESKELLSDFNGGKLDYVALRSIDYLKEWSKVNSRLAFGPVRGDRRMRRFLLLVHADTDMLHIEEMKGRKLAIVKNDELGSLFLNTTLLEQDLSEADTFFSQIEEKEKPSQAALAVFFGQIDACIINEHSFNLMKELNPQIGARLRVLVSSPELLETVGLFRQDMKETLIRNVLENGISLGDTDRGRQILVLFKIDGLFHLKPSDIASVTELYKQYLRFKRPKQKI